MTNATRRTLLGALTAALLVACTGDGAPASDAAPETPAADVLSLGVVMPLSGQTATYGEESMNGLRMAVDEINAGPGPHLSFVYKDNKGDSTETAKLVSQLIKIDKVNVIVGAVASTNTLKGAKVAQENGIPMMTPASTNVAITEKGDFISRICFIDPVQGQALAKLVDTLGKKKAVLVIDKASDYSVGLADAFRETLLANGGEVVGEETFTAGEADFSALITKVASEKPEVVFLPAYYGDVGPMLKQAGDKWKDLIIVAGDGIDSPDLFKLMGDYQGKIYMSTHFAPDDTEPKVKDFVDAYKDRFGKTPGAMAALGYDAAFALQDAFERAGSTDPTALKDAINSIKGLHGVTGTITINAERNADKDVVILEVSPAGSKFHTRIPVGG